MQCMARKRSMKKRKLEPAVQTMTFNVPTGYNTLDLSRCASIVNRRFYRQGINWVVAGFRVFKPGTAANPGTGVSIAKLPNTWVLGNAWEKAFRHWQDLNKRAIEAGESLPGRFTDFKVYMDDIHHGSAVGVPNNNLLPVDYDNTVATPGEWEYSKIILPNSNAAGAVSQREIIAVGANYPGVGTTGFDAVSLIQGYANSRALPSIEDPNTPDDSTSASGPVPENWLSTIDNEGTRQVSEVLSDLKLDNNIAPYPFENDGTNVVTMYPGGESQLPGLQFVDAAYFSTAENANKLYLKGDNFPCGLVRIYQDTDQDVFVQVDLVPGTHRGYLCEPMTEM